MLLFRGEDDFTPIVNPENSFFRIYAAECTEINLGVFGGGPSILEMDTIVSISDFQ